jgi:hypothetical protein
MNDLLQVANLLRSGGLEPFSKNLLGLGCRCLRTLSSMANQFSAYYRQAQVQYVLHGMSSETDDTWGKETPSCAGLSSLNQKGTFSKQRCRSVGPAYFVV